jgi:hypothetical protein
VYTGLLIVALLAQLAGIGFLWLDYSEYPAVKPPAVQDRARTAAPAGPGQPPPAGQLGGPGPGANPPPGGAQGMIGGQPPAPPGKAPGMP